jgi:putative endopeptidase
MSFSLARPLALAFTVAAIAACTKKPQAAPAPAPAAPAMTVAPAAPPISLANLDTTCKACADFYEYANGGWLKNNTIPAAYSRWGAFNELNDRNQAVLHQVLDDAAMNKSADQSADVKKVGIYYASCMDSAAIEAAGAKPLEEELRRINAVKDLKEMRAELARLHLMNVNVVFGEGSGQDFKASTNVIFHVGQGGLGLPERDYYLRKDSASIKIRDAYVADITGTLQLIGDTPEAAKAGAAKIMSIETALANASMPRVAMRDPNATYHPMTISAFDSLAPNIDISSMLVDWKAPKITSLNVAQPDFFKAANAMLVSVPLDDWKTYMRWHYVSRAAPWLSSAFVNEDFKYQQTQTGAKELLPRWKRCLSITDRQLGEAVGQAYVAVTFSPEAKARALAMVKNMESVLSARIDSLPWMSAATKQQAQAKLAAFLNKIGYPDTWRDYSAMEIKKGPFVNNYFAADVFESHRDLAKIGQPLDRLEWSMTPPTVNASYNPLRNQISFPAGILQPPFYNPNADDAVNYGGIGAVIGHEMSHGFDDQGRQFDAQGNLRDWWTAADAAEYNRRAKLVEMQFASYIGIDTLHVNGKLTLGENIGDLGGLKIAYTAYILSLHGKPAPMIDGYTGPQRFFLSWAQVWRQLQRPEALRRQLLTDPHAPGMWRVNGPLSNMPEFAAAFSCHAGDAMVRPDSLRAQIW